MLSVHFPSEALRGDALFSNANHQENKRIILTTVVQTGSPVSSFRMKA